MQPKASIFDHLATLFFMPSFYGGVMWMVWFGLYMLGLLAWDRPTGAAMAVFVMVAVAYVLSNVIYFPSYRRWYVARSRETNRGEKRVSVPVSGPAVLLFHALGFLGLALFVASVSSALGGVATFIRYFLTESWRIRAVTMAMDPPGVELTYFGWLAIFLTALLWSQRKVPTSWLMLAALQFAGNLLFIDRTRPTWIVFVCLLLILPFGRGVSFKRLLVLMASTATVLVVVFLVIAQWMGKNVADDRYGETILPYWAQGLYSYGTGSFAYFNRIFLDSSLSVGLPDRTMAPVFKTLAYLGIGPMPPPEVLEFYDVPFAVNVGTFLEPFYQDGGLLYLSFGILLYSFGWDLVGLLLLRQRSAMSVVMWANICHMTAIGFFVPKVGSTAMWLFAILTIGSIVISWIRFPSAQMRTTTSPRDARPVT